MTKTIIEAYNFGNEVDWNEEEQTWFIKETGLSNTHEVVANLICPKCKMKPTEDNHDPCIKNLPGVRFACCGHGVDDGYIWFENGVMITGKFEIEHHKHTDIMKE